MIIAKVNDYKISDYEFKAELTKVMQDMKIQQPTPKAKKRALEQLIDAYLLIEKAKKADIKVTEDEIDERLLELELDYDSAETFNQMLKVNNMTRTDLRNKIENEIMISKYCNCCIKEEINIPFEKLEEVYHNNKKKFITRERIKASHILIKGNSEESLKKIQKLRNQINSKEDFKQAAKECSECPSACKEGDLGYFVRGKMIRSFEKKAFSLDVDEISEPIKTSFGYHIIMVTDKKPSKTLKYEEVKDILAQRLKRIESELKLIQKIKIWRAEADIEIKKNFL